MEKTKFIMTVGLPKSGKSIVINELLKKNKDIKVYYSLENNEHQFQQMMSDLKLGISVIYSGGNINYKKRRSILERLKDVKCIKECILVISPYSECAARIECSREQQTLRYMYEHIHIPQYYEGWNNIALYYNIKDKKEYKIDDLFFGVDGLIHLSQDNKHHTKTIGSHCLRCMVECKNLGGNKELRIAALLHDIGKLNTKNFSNKRGEITTDAHYYQHEVVSAYESLIYLKDKIDKDKILMIVNYIQWHMRVRHLKTQKAKDRFTLLVGVDEYENFIILDKADNLSK